MPELETLLSIEDEVNAVLNDLGIPEKLSEMDDFMNQNDLKVSITNENAVVTGLVTYTCTVKDKDNNSLPNKVVEWYKGTTLLGMDATDSNGISTFSHRVTEADIYDVHAVVRGTHAGDDIRMFVKDKNNLIPVNLWSGSDFLGNVTNEGQTEGFGNFACSIGLNRLSSSSDWVSNGNRSVKYDSNSESNYCEYHCHEFDNTKNHTASIVVFSPSATVQLQLIAIDLNDRSNDITKSVTANNTECEVSVSINSSELNNHDELRFRVLISKGLDKIIYFDDCKLLES